MKNLEYFFSFSNNFHSPVFHSLIKVCDKSILNRVMILCKIYEKIQVSKWKKYINFWPGLTSIQENLASFIAGTASHIF